jgi:hypothetical protein
MALYWLAFLIQITYSLPMCSLGQMQLCTPSQYQRMASKRFFKAANCKSANSWTHSVTTNPQISKVPVRKSKKPLIFMVCKSHFCIFLQITAQLCLKTVLKVIYVQGFYVQIYRRAYMLYSICKEKK